MTQDRQDSGFSLIEVMVALGILATAAVSLSTLTSGSLKGVVEVEDRYFARTIADNLLVEAFTDRAILRIGVVRGETSQMGREFHWVRTISETQQADLVSIEIQILDSPEGTVLVQSGTLKQVSL